MQIDVVDFSCGEDGVNAIYLDGEIVKYGDYYHDKINDWIAGYLECATTFLKLEIRHWELLKPDLRYEYFAPDKFSQIDMENLEQCG